MRTVRNLLPAAFLAVAAWQLPEKWHGVLLIAFFVWLLYLCHQLYRRRQQDAAERLQPTQRAPNSEFDIDAVVDALGDPSAPAEPQSRPAVTPCTWPSMDDDPIRDEKDEAIRAVIAASSRHNQVD